MKNILQNFEDASTGQKPSVAGESSNEMKKILESFNNVTECGDMPMAQPEPDKVNMNVNISAQGEEGIEQLIKIMAGAQHASGHTADVPMITPQDQEMDMAAMRKIMAAGESDDVDEEWDNAPEEEYSDHQKMTKDLSGGLNREKKAYKAAQPGDNAMSVESIKERLLAALEEKKAKPDYIDLDGDGDTEEPMKKAAKDKEEKDED